LLIVIITLINHKMLFLRILFYITVGFMAKRLLPGWGNLLLTIKKMNFNRYIFSMMKLSLLANSK